MTKATRDSLLQALIPATRTPGPRFLRPPHRVACLPPASLAGLGMPQVRPSWAPLPLMDHCHFDGSLAHHQPLPLHYFRCGSVSLGPGSLCRPHTSKNQLALPSSRTRATLESVSSCVKRACSHSVTLLTPYPSPFAGPSSKQASLQTDMHFLGLC